MLYWIEFTERDCFYNTIEDVGYALEKSNPEMEGIVDSQTGSSDERGKLYLFLVDTDNWVKLPFPGTFMATPECGEEEYFVFNGKIFK